MRSNATKNKERETQDRLRQLYPPQREKLPDAFVEEIGYVAYFNQTG